MQNGVAVMVDCSRTDGCEQVLLELLTGLPALDQRREDASLVSRQHCDIVPQSFTITVELSLPHLPNLVYHTANQCKISQCRNFKKEYQQYTTSTCYTAFPIGPFIGQT